MIENNMGSATSPEKGKIFPAISAIMSELEAVARGRRNEQQRFMYRGIDDLYNALQPLLAKHQVFTAPEVLEERREARASKSGGVLIHVVLKIRYRYYASDGSYFDTVVIGEGMDSGDKASNKALSVGHKYSLTQTFAVRTEDQPDPDSESHQVTNQRAAQVKGAAASKVPTTPTGPATPGKAMEGGKGDWESKRITERQRAMMWALAKKAGYSKEQMSTAVKASFGKDSSKDLTQKEASSLIEELKQAGAGK